MMSEPLAPTPEPTDPCLALPDRRGAERLPCPDLPEVRYLLRPSLQRGVAWLRDLSAEGVGLLMPRPLLPGSVLLLQFPGPHRGTTRTQLAQVVHATAFQARTWLVGCRLSPPLADDDLARLRRQWARH